MNDTQLAGKKILIVDDEEDLRDIVASEFEFIGANVFQAANVTKAKTILSENSVDLIISDIRMPGETGIDLLEYSKGINPLLPPVILITGFADITTEEAHDRGAEALLSKPFMLDELIRVATRLTSSSRDKFLSAEEFSKILRPSEDVCIRFGRGGFTIELSKLEKVNPGETVGFDFRYFTKHLAGSAICRWIKILENDPSRFLAGLEILSLKDQSLAFFEEMISTNPEVSFIPSVKH